MRALLTARAIRSGRVVGYSTAAGQAGAVGVAWDLQGDVVRTLPGSADVKDVTSSGDVLGGTPDGELPGPAKVWRVNGAVDQPPVGAVYEKIADDGSPYGDPYREGAYTPVRMRRS